MDTNICNLHDLNPAPSDHPTRKKKSSAPLLKAMTTVNNLKATNAEFYQKNQDLCFSYATGDKQTDPSNPTPILTPFPKAVAGNSNSSLTRQLSDIQYAAVAAPTLAPP